MKALILACLTTTLLCTYPNLKAVVAQSATQQHQQAAMVHAIKQQPPPPVPPSVVTMSPSVAPHVMMQPVHTMPVMHQAQPSAYMYVLLASDGVIKQDGHGRWTLTLNKVDMKHIVKFSDHPLRIVKYVSPTMVSQQWSPGAKNFAISSPNAAVVINQHIQLVQLVTMHVQSNQVVYEIKPVQDPLYPLSGGPVSVFMM